MKKLIITALILSSSFCFSQSDEWTYIFDGKSFNGWHQYNSETVGSQWSISNGELIFTNNLDSKQDIVTVNEYSNFEKEDALEAQVDLALAFIKGLSLNTKIDSSLIANRAKVTSFVYTNSQNEAILQDHPLCQTWRNEFCGKHLSKLLKGEGTIRVNPKSKIPSFTENE